MIIPISELRVALSETYETDRITHNQTFLEQQNKSEKETIDRLFHQTTKYNRPQTIRERASFSQFEEPEFIFLELATTPDYSGYSTIDLPKQECIKNIDLSKVLVNRRSIRSFDGTGISPQSLSSILQYACGESLSEQTQIDEFEIPITRSRRTYPSGGGLYPVEIYPLLLRVDDRPSGITYYNAEEGKLRMIKRKNRDTFAEDVAEKFAGDDIDIENAALVIILTATFARARAKYGPRSYRNILIEAGHIAQNIQLVSEALGLGSVPAAGFYDDNLNSLLAVDGMRESCIYAMVIGNGADSDE
jgi:SagB-type dehydrogenase family enzyme